MREPDLPSELTDTLDDSAETDSSSLKVWNDVPDGSTLELSLTPAGGAFVGRVVLAIRGVEAEQWPDEEIHPGPRQRSLSADDRRYSVNVFVGFAGGQETAILSAVLLDSSGDPIDEPYIHAMPGQNGDVKTATILINMA